MSYSALYVVFPKSVRTVAEYPNGWGTAPPLWNLLWGKYVEPGCFNFPLHTADGGRGTALWKLHDDPRLEAHHRLVFWLTCDRGVIPKAMLSALASACDTVHDEIRVREPKNVNHWRDVAQHVRALLDPQGYAPPAPAPEMPAGTSIRDAFLYPPQNRTGDFRREHRLLSRSVGVGMDCTSVCQPMLEWADLHRRKRDAPELRMYEGSAL